MKIYVLELLDPNFTNKYKYYVGKTNNLKLRIEQHKNNNPIY